MEKTSDLHRLLLNLPDVALSNICIFCTWKIIAKSQKSNKIKISAPTWNGKFEIPDVSHSVSVIQDYFKYSIKENLPQMPETMKLLRSTKSKITKDEDGKNVPRLKIMEVVIVYCNIVKNHYQHYSRFLYEVAPNKCLGQLLDISFKTSMFLKIFNTEFS